MHGWIDIVRLSPQDESTLAQVDRFRANEAGEAPLMMARGSDSNGYWRRGMALDSGG